jgi:hypothetical protein
MIAMKRQQWAAVGIVILCYIGAALILVTKMPDTIVIGDFGSTIQATQPILWAMGFILIGSFIAGISSDSDVVWKLSLVIGAFVGLGFVLLLLFWVLPAFLNRLG